MFCFFALFTVSVRTRPGSSACVFHAGVSEQALHGDAHSPGKDALQGPVPVLPLALLAYSHPRLLVKRCTSCLGCAAAGVQESCHSISGCTFKGSLEETLRLLLFESARELFTPLGKQECARGEEPGEVCVAPEL